MPSIWTAIGIVVWISNAYLYCSFEEAVCICCVCQSFTANPFPFSFGFLFAKQYPASFW